MSRVDTQRCAGSEGKRGDQSLDIPQFSVSSILLFKAKAAPSSPIQSAFQ